MYMNDSSTLGNARLEFNAQLSTCILDVDDVKYVINYDYPNSSEDYIHRIGRTGRSDQTGTAYTFFTPNNSRQAKDLVNVLQEARQEVNPELSKMAMRGGGGGGNWRGNNSWGYQRNRNFGGSNSHKKFNHY
ncbi:putative ATP-dependent RNA helicase ddx17 [Homalodisca vitripennis]|nr:putative ATP-dependent RNA helicase ddx17 [Homalodisca vitripennis]